MKESKCKPRTKQEEYMLLGIKKSLRSIRYQEEIEAGYNLLELYSIEQRYREQNEK